jgi:hypothetical protein
MTPHRSMSIERAAHTLLVIVTALQEWRIYLKNFKYPVKVLTNHKNLIWFTIIKVLNRRQVR